MNQTELDAKLEIAVEGELIQSQLTPTEIVTKKLHEQAPFTGWWKELWSNGQVKQLREFKDGKPDGPWIAWHENGQKKSESNYKRGKQQGSSILWDENGRIVQAGRWVMPSERHDPVVETEIVRIRSPRNQEKNTFRRVEGISPIGSPCYQGPDNSPRNQGKDAFRRGVGIDQNPFQQGDPKRFAWMEGWVYEKTYRPGRKGD